MTKHDAVRRSIWGPRPGETLSEWHNRLVEDTTIPSTPWEIRYTNQKTGINFRIWINQSSKVKMSDYEWNIVKQVLGKVSEFIRRRMIHNPKKRTVIRRRWWWDRG